jgi:hypothetical protein
LVLALVMMGLSLSGCRRHVGGPCTYEHWADDCELVRVEVTRAANSERRTLRAHYVASGSGEVGQANFDVHSDAEEAAYRAWVEAHPQVTCRGSRILRGTCVPSTFRADLPEEDAPAGPPWTEAEVPADGS